MAELSLKSVRKSYGKVEVIKGVDLDIKDGEFVVFVGPSGCGKSTLLRMIAGLEDISDGTLEIGGKTVNDLQPKERGIAMVFQTYAIFPHMSVRENVAFGLTIAGVPKKEKEEAVQRAARILQMEHLLDRRPSQLSGGQRQRVAIGRAIVRNPSVFLFDEPLSNLDAALRMDMRMEIGKLHNQLDATMIYVTHDQVEAMTLADRIVVLKDGKIMQIGSPRDLYEKPDNLFVAQFIGSPKMNILPCTGGDGKYAIEGHGGGDLPDGTGGTISRKDYAGRPIILIFYLGYGCLHCAEQLEKFAKSAKLFEENGFDVLAISTDSETDLIKSREKWEKDGGSFPFPLVADPALKVFREWSAYDDFEKSPLHGTFVISPSGKVLWQDISSDPFMDCDFLVTESQRLLELHGQDL